jgi:hypothetical protein
MKRLRELPANTPLIAQVQRLLNAAPSALDSPVHMQRVRRAIERAPARGSSGLLRAPAFAVAGVLLLFGASAFAAVRVWVEHRAAATTDDSGPLAAALPRASDTANSAPLVVPQLAAADEPTDVARVAHAVPKVAADQSVRSRVQPARVQKRKRVRRHSAIRARSSAARVAAKAAVADRPLQLAQAEDATPLSAAAPAATVAAASEPRVHDANDVNDERDERDDEETAASPEPARFSRAEKRSSDSELVVRAVQTLRRDHDPELASRLLEKYRTRNPAGVLAEEVLSLQVEAAVAGGDARARSFAREYLARYPDGRYRARASRALAGAPP